MSQELTILLVEDEPLILMDLEFAVEDLGCKPLAAITQAEALDLVGSHSDEIDVAILDVSLGHGETCLPVAQKLQELGIPFILHTGEPSSQDARIRDLGVKLIAKPAPAPDVVRIAIAQAGPGGGGGRLRAAA